MTNETNNNAAKIAAATDAAQKPTLMISGGGKPLLPPFYALRSGRTGQLVLEEAYCDDTGVFEWRGPVLAFFDQDEAERRASSLNEDYPIELIEVVPMPHTPPTLSRPPRANDSEVTGAFFTVVRGDEIVRINLRPQTLSHSKALLGVLNEIVAQAAMRIADVRLSPVTLITVGPQATQVGPEHLPATSVIPAPDDLDQEAA